jgi:hypothetical protein
MAKGINERKKTAGARLNLTKIKIIKTKIRNLSRAIETKLFTKDSISFIS